MTLASYVSKKRKTVLLVSSMHNDDEIDPSSGITKKPPIITFYNITKAIVDCVDLQIPFCNVARTTKRWPMVTFYSLLNIVTINIIIISKSNNLDENNIKDRRAFIRILANTLQKRILEQVPTIHTFRNVFDRHVGKC